MPCPEAVRGRDARRPYLRNSIDQVAMSYARPSTAEGARGKKPLRLAQLFIGLLAFLFAACEQEDPETVFTDVNLEAVEIWAHPDTLGIDVYAPLDFKAASREVVWAIDRVAGGVMRYQPSKGEHGIFGMLENPPAQVVAPARLAIAENTGVFVFDDSTGMVDMFTPGGQFVRGFEPGLRPSILEVSRRPLRLTYGVRTFSGSDSIPTLSVIQTDFLGQNPDTLLSPETGPELLRSTPAVGGRIAATQGISGLWVFAKAASDTVFEISARGPGRRLVLPEADTIRAGVLADLEQEILWIASPRPRGGIEYEAYDISGEGVDGLIDGREAYLGVRTTPLGFLARVAYDGSVSGWWRGERSVYAPRGFDMRIEELREDADVARRTRDSRRVAVANEWAEVLAVVEEARRQAEEEAQRIREEE